MLKHCSPSSVDIRRRSRRNLTDFELTIADSLSLGSFSSSSNGSSSFAGSPRRIRTARDRIGTASTPSSPRTTPRGSRNPSLVNAAKTTSFVTLSDHHSFGPRVPIKVYCKCLRQDIEYKTLSVSNQTTSKDMIWQLLSKFKMKHRDPKLFYLTMDISIKRTGIPLRKTLSLEDESRPAELKTCHPWGECKFTLQMKKGGLVRIHDSVLMAESKYKCLLISEETTVEEVIRIMFHCYGLERIEQVERYCLYEQCQSLCYERRLSLTDLPVQVQSVWPNPGQFMFVLRTAPLHTATMTEPEELDTSYGSSGESTASSEYSALNFRDSPESSSCRSSRANSGTPNPFLKSTITSLDRQISLHSLLEALPAASVDSGPLDVRSKRASLSSLSTGSQSSDYDSFFYI